MLLQKSDMPNGSQPCQQGNSAAMHTVQQAINQMISKQFFQKFT
jgi:hypothetical protein